jgi:UDP-N-acetylmuramate dehydrogenase
MRREDKNITLTEKIISENFPVSRLNTMRLGGPARYVIAAENRDDVVAAYEFAGEKNLPVFILGGGSNVIGRDEGFGGAVILNGIRGIEILGEPGDCIRLKCGAGERLDDLCALVSEKGYTGAEALSAIPGTIGGAVVQNSGAYGQEIKDIVTGVEIYDSERCLFRTLRADECGFSYRRSVFGAPSRGARFITAVFFEMRNGNMARPLYASLARHMEENGFAGRGPAEIRAAVTSLRAAKLPDPARVANSGSFFKNIRLSQAGAEDAAARGIKILRRGGENFVPAGWLVEEAGFKGRLIRGIRVSEKSALVLINESASGYGDLAAARDEIVRAVKEKFGFTLEQEPVEMTPG